MDFIQLYFKNIGISEEYIPQLLALAEKLQTIPAWGKLVERFHTENGEVNPLLREAAELAAPLNCHPYTAHFLFYTFCGERTLEQYRAKGISEEIYWDSMRDLRWKFDKCVKNHGIPGIFTEDWHAAFYRMTRFTLGRFEYEHAIFKGREDYHFGTFDLHPGDPVIFFHIPASGPMQEDVRLASYRKAYDFYKNEFADGIVPLVTSSWLLFQKHYEMLSPESNIVSFMNDFDILYFRETEAEGFSNAWRVFGPDAVKPPQEWPRNTALQRGYADLLCSGGHVGDGYGLILFDGEKILNNKKA